MATEFKSKAKSSVRKPRSVEVRLPASTSNLGAGFDCFGLALQLYLTIRATAETDSGVSCRIDFEGSDENTTALPRDSENLIYRSMAYVAAREGIKLPPVHLTIQNDIPISRGLGGSAAAIVGGIKLCEMLTGREIPDEKVMQYASEFEGHADNIVATLLGGFVVTSISRQGRIVAIKSPWPDDIEIVVVAPELHLVTKLARAALPRMINHIDGVFNLQRSALFSAALFEKRYDVLWEAMQDRLHQEKRSTLVPGLPEALSLPRMPGLLGLALSGAGPSVLALAQDNFDEIADTIAQCFRRHGIGTTTHKLQIDNNGFQSRVLKQPRASRIKSA